jgi:lipid II:glycine glycyltransferase (peptidoglycan interpeptide bridge formation enzyme)
MEISEISDKGTWESFAIGTGADSFLHSWNWGEFNRSTGDRIWRLGFYESGALIGLALVLRVAAKRGVFLFVPHGPLVGNAADLPKVMESLKAHLVDLGKEERAAFIRISPLAQDSEENRSLFQELGFKDAPIHMMHPEATWILDISPDEETLMRGMRKTHRNLIRRAIKDGVEISGGATEEYLKHFYDIHMETVRRHGFVPFSYDYIRQELENFRGDDQIRIYAARYQGEVISSAIVVFYGDEAFYHHGASSSRHSKVPSSYLTLWTAIQEAKARGIRKFNFYGIVDNKPKHPWYGLSQFKKGFGGAEQRLVHCQDFRLSWKYAITFAVETFRKIRRGY